MAEGAIDVFAGASTGAFKGINLATSSFSNLTPIGPLEPKKDEVTALAWADEDQTDVLAARLDRSLSLFHRPTLTFAPFATVTAGTGRVRALETLPEGRVLSGVESGVVQTWDRDGEELSSLDAGPSLYAMRLSPEKKLATGGRESFLRLWDLETGQATYTAKNVKPDFLQLRRPVWVRDVRFFPEAPHTLATATGHSQVRLYDPRSGQRRPVSEVEWGEEPFQACDVAGNHLVVAGNTKGGMALFDLRGKSGKGNLVHVYKGMVGAVRGIQLHPRAPVLASVSADRFLRIHHRDTKQMLHKIYCKTPLNALLLRDDLSIVDGEGNLKPPQELKPEPDVKKEERSDGESDGDDDVWEDMGTVGEKGRKRATGTTSSPPASPERKRRREPPSLKRKDGSPPPEPPKKARKDEKQKKKAKRRKLDE